MNLGDGRCDEVLLRPVGVERSRMITRTAHAAAVLGTVLGACALAIAAPAVAASNDVRPAVAFTKTKKPKQPPELYGTVSLAGAVRLTNAHGAVVKHLSPGWYTVAIAVKTNKADFHLVGPDTNKSTGKRFVGDVLWGVHFVKGTYRYLSDATAKGTEHTISVS